MPVLDNFTTAEFCSVVAAGTFKFVDVGRDPSVHTVTCVSAEPFDTVTSNNTARALAGTLARPDTATVLVCPAVRVNASKTVNRLNGTNFNGVSAASARLPDGPAATTEPTPLTSEATNSTERATQTALSTDRERVSVTGHIAQRREDTTNHPTQRKGSPALADQDHRA
ncbi:hypothetical protein [Actinopolymorpha alba]|uniref:hypothetical protein n=1 Tax=Actinopolymorpha alba TaxID=533267 RepID=UPI0012F63B8A|nr:hypothetical protein [Actinopolymorpha alba]